MKKIGLFVALAAITIAIQACTPTESGGDASANPPAPESGSSNMTATTESELLDKSNVGGSTVKDGDFGGK